jgi:pimeloyl-ACP methyl ester carboxylesterase
VLLLLGDGTQVTVTELPGDGPWTFLILQPETPGPAETPVAPNPDPAAGLAGLEPGEVARALTRFGRAVLPDLRGRPGWGEPPGGPGFLDLVDDLDQVRTRAGLGRPVLVGLGELAPVALRAAADQPWAWRALVLAPPATRLAASAALDQLDLPALVLDADPASATGMAALERLLGRLGGGPGWAGIAPDAPPR